MIYKDIKAEYLSRNTLKKEISKKNFPDITADALENMSKVDLLSVLKKNGVKTLRVLSNF